MPEVDAGVAIVARLRDVAAVTAEVGTERIYPHHAPPTKRVYPLIAYHCSGDDRGDTATGASRLVSETVTIACIATSYAGTKRLAAAVFVALNNQEGTWGGIVVQGCFRENPNEDSPILPDTDQRFFVHESQYQIFYETPIS